MTIDESELKGRISSEVENVATTMLQQFKPLSNVTMNFSTIGAYAEDPTRQVCEEHLSASISDEVRQCLIYDSASEKRARLIGVEYTISRRLFEGLPEDEKRYWHSHVAEIKSGLMTMPRVPEMLENIEMRKLADTYSKKWLFWQVDRGDALPYGEPKLMCSIGSEAAINEALLVERDKRHSMDTRKIRPRRLQMALPVPHAGADQFWKKHLGVSSSSIH